ncbi:FMN reductase [Thalassotalea insulae]|uniref:FMN reductase n=1 Tax=Thalassotalea insulae TaxID=2056778 RepID=A0ABQ6GNL9_9GAMM|nr:NAD(P)H-dependent oxidoreductase [Thalassotalea insulae]GLX76909.1 FMN reductase [Thalassotalea insulae]
MESCLKVLIISASQKAQSNSFAVARYIQTNIFTQMAKVESSILDLSRYPALLDHYGTEQGSNELLAEQKSQVINQLYQCDAVVFVVPEWGGMVPPALVNLLLLTANGSAGGLPLGHKPAFAIGISASGGGTYPVSLLKGYASKNSHLTWVPLHGIVQNVEDFIHYPWQPEQESRFAQVQSRLQVGLKSLTIYAERLKGVREELVQLSQLHPFGQ